MKTKEIALRTDTLTPEQIDLVKRTVAKGATDDELKLFLYTASRTGLDPLTKQVHFIKRKVWNNRTKSYDEVGTTQTGIDGYRVVAQRNKLAGIDDAIYDSEDGIHPKKATVTVYKLIEGTRVAFTASARWSEYVASDRDGNPVAMWKKMPYLMLAKVAEALALRKAFPNDLSGLYTNEEMSQADAPVIHQAEYDQSPVKDADVPIVQIGEGKQYEPPEEVEPTLKVVKNSLDAQKRKIKDLIDSIVQVELETAEEYRDYVKAHTGLELEAGNYTDIITRLETLKK